MTKQEKKAETMNKIVKERIEVGRLKCAIELALFHLRRNDHVDQPHGPKCTQQMIQALEAELSPTPRMRLNEGATAYE